MIKKERWNCERKMQVAEEEMAWMSDWRVGGFGRHIKPNQSKSDETGNQRRRRRGKLHQSEGL